MKINSLNQSFNIKDSIAVVTGGGGVLCTAMARELSLSGAKVVLLDISLEAAQNAALEINAGGGDAMALKCDVLDRVSVETSAQTVLEKYGRVDILINGAGGNKAEATTSPEKRFFDLPPEAVQWVFNLNFLGTLIPSQVYGEIMADQGSGAILNISSMNAFQPLTRIPAYSGAKAAVSNFTQWLAVHMAQEYSPKIRVNALAPGFFLTEQNRFLLMDPDSGHWTARGQTILDHTPQNRFGDPEDLLGTMLWLLSPASDFVTGVVVPVDGGFSAFSGV